MNNRADLIKYYDWITKLIGFRSKYLRKCCFALVGILFLKIYFFSGKDNYEWNSFEIWKEVEFSWKFPILSKKSSNIRKAELFWFLRLTYFHFMCVSVCLYVICMCTVYMTGACRGQRRASYSLKLCCKSPCWYW